MAQAPRPWYQIVARNQPGNKAAGNKSGTRAEVRIYTDIGVSFWGDGITAEEFSNDIAALDVDQLDVRINSGGGSAWEGVTIANAIRRHPAHTTAYVDGLAASAASYIARAADEVVISKYGQFMVHDGIGAIMGNAAEMKAAADTLDKLSDSVAAMYADWAGDDVKAWRKRMSAETWFNAEESVAVGLADRVDEAANEPEMDVAASLNMSRLGFRYAGRQSAPAPMISARNQTPPLIEAEETPQRKEPTVATLSESALGKLGLDADADDSAIEEAINALADKPTVVNNVVTEPTMPELVASAAKAGLKLVDEDTLAELQAQAKLGADAHAQLTASNDAALVEDAIRKGKIPPAARDKYLKNMGIDRETYTARLEALEEGTIPVAERGHAAVAQSGSTMQVPDDLSWFDTAPTEPTNEREDA